MGKITILPPGTERIHNAVNTLPTTLQTPAGLALLEIQGSINSTFSDHVDGTKPSMDIGKLSFPLYDYADPPVDNAWQKRVHLIVGEHQRLTGELKKLPNPLAVLRRRQDDASMDTSEDDQEQLEVVEIIYYKLIFNHRPEPYGVTAET